MQKTVNAEPKNWIAQRLYDSNSSNIKKVIRTISIFLRETFAAQKTENKQKPTSKTKVSEY